MQSCKEKLQRCACLTLANGLSEAVKESCWLRFLHMHTQRLEVLLKQQAAIVTEDLLKQALQRTARRHGTSTNESSGARYERRQVNSLTNHSCLNKACFLCSTTQVPADKMYSDLHSRL